MQTLEKVSKNAKAAHFAAIHDEAVTAANIAHTLEKPAPMTVGTPTSLFGNDIDHSKPTYFVADGPCGFAYALVRDARRPFCKWLIATGNGSYSNYDKGVCVRDRLSSQSLARKEAWVAAYIKVLNSHGIDHVRFCSRLD